jgi:hypothetical protein
VAGHHMAATTLVGLLATGVHTTAYLAVTGILAWLVYCKFGLALLRKLGSTSTCSGEPHS